MWLNMQVVEAFLIFTAVCYYAASLLGAFFKPTTKNVRPVALEVFLMFLMGSIILLNLFLGLSWLWLGMGALWSLASVLSFLGYMQWNIVYEAKQSDIHQVAMCLWDMAVAVCCLLMF